MFYKHYQNTNVTIVLKVKNMYGHYLTMQISYNSKQTLYLSLK